MLGSLSDASGAAAALTAEHEETMMIGRTLLQQAVPVTFGLVAAGWMTGLDEARRTLAAVRRERLAVQFGGAAGTLAALGTAGPRVAALLAGELGLAEPVLPWHTSRLRITELAAALAGACAAAGKIARDVTLLAQTEVAEVREGGPEPDGPGPRRGGSSAMPHKRNPVAAIAVLGCARQAPGLLATLTASAEQEHQRAAGAWHAEWQPLTRLLQLTGSAAAWCAELLAGLEVDAAAMRANLDDAGGLPLAEHVTTVLAPRLGRQAAHDLVAGAAARSGRTGRPFRDELASAIAGSGSGAAVGPDDIDAALDPSGYLGAASQFVRRALAAHRDTERALADTALGRVSPGSVREHTGRAGRRRSRARDAGGYRHPHRRAVLPVAQEGDAVARGGDDGEQADGRDHDHDPVPDQDGPDQQVDRGDDQKQPEHRVQREQRAVREGLAHAALGRGDVEVHPDAQRDLDDDHDQGAHAGPAQPAQRPRRAGGRRPLRAARAGHTGSVPGARTSPLTPIVGVMRAGRRTP